MHRDHLVGNRYFVPFFVFYTESTMLGPRLIHESIFYTQSVMLSVRVLYLSACFVLFSTFAAMQYQICFFYTFSNLRNLKKCAQRRNTIPQGQQHVSSLQQS